MADISKIKTLDGTTYDIKDATARSDKLDIAQGSANAGKYLVVGNDGNITVASLPVWDGSVT